MRSRKANKNVKKSLTHSTPKKSVIKHKSRKLTTISDNIFTHSDEEILSEIEMDDTANEHIDEGKSKHQIYNENSLIK